MNGATPRRAFALIAAGGTGGHVYPGIAVADALVARGHGRDTIRFVTESRPLTTGAIERAGYAFDVIALQHGLQRRLTFANVKVVLDALRSFIQSWQLISRHRPQVVLGFGAYVSLPLIVAARVRRVPVCVHEQNGYPGLANRIAVRMGAVAATSLPNTPLRGATVTGNPVRPAVVAVQRSPRAVPLVAFVGGSLGAGVLDDAALGLYDQWRARDDISVRHVSGTRSAAACEQRLAASRRPTDRLDYELVDYEHDMPGLYRDAAVVVARAGGSVAELAAAGVPSVLVPWSGATEHHQHANARVLSDAGAAVLLEEADCTAERLGSVLDDLIEHAGRLDAMSAAARDLARPDAADHVAQLSETIARP